MGYGLVCQTENSLWMFKDLGFTSNMRNLNSGDKQKKGKNGKQLYLGYDFWPLPFSHFFPNQLFVKGAYVVSNAELLNVPHEIWLCPLSNRKQ